MKSYQSHLTSTQSFGEDLPPNYRPTMRSSAVFPVRISGCSLDTEVTFLGYWLLKRGLNEVTAVLTLRDAAGSSVRSSTILIDEVRSFSFSMREFLQDSSQGEVEFLGSIEVEIFSARDMVFPYPAITFAYKSPLGTAFVHTCGRIHNDLYDMVSNSSLSVPESGFDILPGDDFEPFLAFVNGPYDILNQDLRLTYINTYGDQKTVVQRIDNIAPYGTAWVPLLGGQIETNFFRGFRGTVRVNHGFEGFFPRFVVGNSFKNRSGMSLTHSYYDTSTGDASTEFWENPDPLRFHDSVISFPIPPELDYVELALYPIHPANQCKLRFHFFQADGSYLGDSPISATLGSGEAGVRYVEVTSLLRELSATNQLVLCRVVIDGGGTVPARMKFGLNFGRRGCVDIPSNVCFNAKVPNPNLLAKPRSFRWCTVFDPAAQSVILSNSSFLKDLSTEADCDIQVWRNCDGQSFDYAVTIPANGALEILAAQREELAEFLQGQTGWISIASSSPWLDGFYILDSGTGLVGADHLY